MPHRGRLAFLVSQLNYPARRLFYKIPGRNEFPDSLPGVVDDVTSHLHASVDKEYPGKSPLS
jgi:2-oxoglutarate dehydrogenase complex dehydrogenase (E1) component-like enzyme